MSSQGTIGPKVSIIVPAYNAGATLGCCLDSLCAQTLREIEILVVDDGSADDTGAISARYAQSDPRVRLLSLAHNRGVSAARNHALGRALGEYIGFCDADDWVEPGMYGALYQAAASAAAQVSFCAVYKDFEARSQEVPLPWQEGTVLDRGAIRGDLVPRMISLDFDGEDQPLSGYTPRNLFARDVLQGAGFRADIHYAEDLLFIVAALLRSERAAVVGAPLYHYRFHAGSTTQRYSPHVPASQYACHAALAELFAAHGLTEALAPRMAIRARRNVLVAVINLCLPGTPYPPLPRIHALQALLRSSEAREAFRRVPLVSLARRQPKQALKLALIRLRWATPLMLLYSYAYHAR